MPERSIQLAEDRPVAFVPEPVYADGTVGTMGDTPRRLPKTDRRPWAVGQPPPVGFDALTPREREVLELYVELPRTQDIADRLGLHLQTVKNYITSILFKLDSVAMGQAAVRYDRYRGATWPAIDRRLGYERRQGDRRVAS